MSASAKKEPQAPPLRQTKTFSYAPPAIECSFSVPKKSPIAPILEKKEVHHEERKSKKRKAEDADLPIPDQGRKMLKREQAETQTQPRASAGRRSKSAPLLTEALVPKEAVVCKGIQPILKKPALGARIDYIKMNKLQIRDKSQQVRTLKANESSFVEPIAPAKLVRVRTAINKENSVELVKCPAKKPAAELSILISKVKASTSRFFYEPTKFSSRVIRAWEKQSGRTWYNLSP